MTNLDSILKKQRHYFANKGPSHQGYGFSSCPVWMWELDYKESWVTKNWCFWTVLLEKTLESALDCKEIQPFHSSWDQSWVFNGGTDVEAETPILWPSDVESWLIWKYSDAAKDWGQEEKGTTEDEMVEWRHWHNGCGFVWTPGVGDGQGGLSCCGSWSRRGLDTTERLNWTNLNRREKLMINCCCQCSVAKSCSTVCDPMDCSPPGSYILGISQARILKGDDISFQCIFLTQGLNPCLLRGRQILYHGDTWEVCDKLWH